MAAAAGRVINEAALTNVRETLIRYWTTISGFNSDLQQYISQMTNPRFMRSHIQDAYLWFLPKLINFNKDILSVLHKNKNANTTVTKIKRALNISSNDRSIHPSLDSLYQKAKELVDEKSSFINDLIRIHEIAAKLPKKLRLSSHCIPINEYIMAAWSMLYNLYNALNTACRNLLDNPATITFNVEEPGDFLIGINGMMKEIIRESRIEENLTELFEVVDGLPVLSARDKCSLMGGGSRTKRRTKRKTQKRY